MNHTALAAALRQVAEGVAAMADALGAEASTDVGEELVSLRGQPYRIAALRAVKLGALQGYKLPGRRGTHVRADDLRAWLERHRLPQEPPPAPSPAGDEVGAILELRRRTA